MGLDFSVLDNISLQDAKKDFEGQPEPKGKKKLDYSLLDDIPFQTAKIDQREPKEEEARLHPPKDKKAATASQRATREAQKTIPSIEGMKKDYERVRAAYTHYQGNIKRSGTLRSEILKGLGAGEDPVILLLKAIDCISGMTGDKALYYDAERKIKAVYGWGLKDKGVLKIMREEAEERLQKLREACKGDLTLSDMQNIANAMDAHKDLIERLKTEELNIYQKELCG